MRVLVSVLVAATLAGPAWTWAEELPPPEAYEACEPETAARLRFLETRLEDGQPHGRYWWYGWTGFYGASMVFSSTRAGLEDDDGERADQIVSAVKALTGVARQLIQRPTARLGADPMLAMPVENEGACRARLARGEELLRAGAEEARQRYSWLLHVGTVLFNVAGGVVVAEGFDEPDGWRNAGIGIAVGEIAHWSHPWRQTSDLEEYERRFPADGLPRGPGVSFGVAPAPGGAALRVLF
jgi:hypothetical protein